MLPSNIHLLKQLRQLSLNHSDIDKCFIKKLKSNTLGIASLDEDFVRFLRPDNCLSPGLTRGRLRAHILLKAILNVLACKDRLHDPLGNAVEGHNDSEFLFSGAADHLQLASKHRIHSTCLGEVPDLNHNHVSEIVLDEILDGIDNETGIA